MDYNNILKNKDAKITITNESFKDKCMILLPQLIDHHHNKLIPSESSETNKESFRKWLDLIRLLADSFGLVQVTFEYVNFCNLSENEILKASQFLKKFIIETTFDQFQYRYIHYFSIRKIIEIIAKSLNLNTDDYFDYNSEKTKFPNLNKFNSVDLDSFSMVYDCYKVNENRLLSSNLKSYYNIHPNNDVYFKFFHKHLFDNSNQQTPTEDLTIPESILISLASDSNNNPQITDTMPSKNQANTSKTVDIELAQFIKSYQKSVEKSENRLKQMSDKFQQLSKKLGQQQESTSKPIISQQANTSQQTYLTNLKINFPLMFPQQQLSHSSQPQNSKSIFHLYSPLQQLQQKASTLQASTSQSITPPKFYDTDKKSDEKEINIFTTYRQATASSPSIGPRVSSNISILSAFDPDSPTDPLTSEIQIMSPIKQLNELSLDIENKSHSQNVLPISIDYSLNRSSTINSPDMNQTIRISVDHDKIIKELPSRRKLFESFADEDDVREENKSPVKKLKKK